jgi:hypothetical protein
MRTGGPGSRILVTPLWVAENSGTGLFSLLTRLSHDSNIGRTFVTDGKGLHDVSFVLVHPWSDNAEPHGRTQGGDDRVGWSWAKEPWHVLSTSNAKE